MEATRIRLILALLLAPATLGLSCGEDPPEPNWFGINTSHAISTGTSDPDDFYRHLKAMGGNALREDVNWHEIEPVNDQWQWGQLDAEIAAVPEDVGVILLFLNSPIWARGPAHAAVCGIFPPPACRLPPDPARLDEWGEMVRETISRYGNQVVAVEVWNEPNLESFWRPNGDEPALWAGMIEATADAVARAQPELPVISGGLSTATVAGPSGGVGMLAGAYLDAAYAADPHLADVVDGIGIHPYPGRVPPDGPGNPFDAALEETRAIRDRVDPGTPLWVTEVGYSTEGPEAVTETQQRDWLLQSYGELASAPDVEAVVIHTLVDPIWQGNPQEQGFGIMHATRPLSPKPAWTAFHDLLGP